MEEYNTREFQDVVLQAGDALHERESHNYFSEYDIEQFLNQSGMQNIPSGSVREACERLVELGQFRRTEVHGGFAITPSGKDQVEGDRER